MTDSNFVWIPAPPGCLQYYTPSSGVVRSFNYASAPNSRANAVGVEGSRQIASLNYGICIAAQSGACSITYSPLSSDPYSFTMTGDVGAVDVSMLGSGLLQDQNCTTDFVIIGNPSQAGAPLTTATDRFCGLGLNPTTSKAFVSVDRFVSLCTTIVPNKEKLINAMCMWMFHVFFHLFR